MNQTSEKREISLNQLEYSNVTKKICKPCFLPFFLQQINILNASSTPKPLLLHKHVQNRRKSYNVVSQVDGLAKDTCIPSFWNKGCKCTFFSDIADRNEAKPPFLSTVHSLYSPTTFGARTGRFLPVHLHGFYLTQV